MDRTGYLDPYQQWVQAHGTDFGATLWASPVSQQRRFEVASAMVYLPGKGILDAGCSRGDFAAWMLEHDLNYDHYVGLDALPEVIAFARSRKLPRCTFQVADLLADSLAMARHQPQVVFVSGTLNTMADSQARQLLEHAWAAATETLIFNFLSNRCGPSAPPQDHFARRIDTMMLLDWSFRKTWNVVFRQDYFNHGHDATIVMQKTARPT